VLTAVAGGVLGALGAGLTVRVNRLWGVEAAAGARAARTVGVAAGGILPALALWEGHPWVAVALWGASLAAAADLATREIPHRFVVLMAACGIVEMVDRSLAVGPALATAAAVGAFFLAVHVISRAGLGLGDVKLAAGAALAVGWPVAVSAVVFGLWAAGLFAGYLVVFRRRSGADGIPLGPFLVLGMAVAVLGTGGL
jgi:leader peptidase (prepilin peptidase)/N-methyltransferase